MLLLFSISWTCLLIPCYHLSNFIGGSCPPRTKASLKRSDKVSRRARIERGPQKHVLEYNEEKNSFVQCSVAAQQACDAKAVEESKKEQRRLGSIGLSLCLISHLLSIER
jgi:hypothetical protein